MNDRTHRTEVPLPVAFVGGDDGQWDVERIVAVSGAPLPYVKSVAVREGVESGESPARATWVLRGVASHERYTVASEHRALSAVQAPLGRASSTAAALIPIRKSPAWWRLAQDERRAIFEEQSHHIARSLPYLPRVARRLHHSRDLGEPFDFLTWFEFAPADAPAFDELAAILRETEEWSYVERDVEVRLRLRSGS